MCHFMMLMPSFRVMGIPLLGKTVFLLQWGGGDIGCYFTMPLKSVAVRYQLHAHIRPSFRWNHVVNSCMVSVFLEMILYRNLETCGIMIVVVTISHWNGNVVILVIYPSLVASQVVKMTTFCTTSGDENFLKRKTFPFQLMQRLERFEQYRS